MTADSLPPALRHAITQPMTSDPFPAIDASALVLIGVSVVAVAESNNPSILNPDFLREFVLPEQSWQVQDAPICTPVYARVSYANGVSVQSDTNRVVFEQRGDPLDPTLLRVATMARRYLTAIPHVKYTAIGTNPSFLLADAQYSDALKNSMRTVLFPTHEDIYPVVLPKAIYAHSDRQITVETQHAQRGGTGDSSILFRGNVHRVVQGNDQRERTESITAIIDRFQVDLNDFRAILGALGQIRLPS